MSIFSWKHRRLFQNSVRVPVDNLTSEVTKESVSGGTSQNWSGYTISSKDGSYSSVSATWTVPKVRAPQSPQPNSVWQWVVQFWSRVFGLSSEDAGAYSATWIGIDGSNNANLIQTGTAGDYVNGVAQYYAWWEIIPKPETPVNPSRFPVQSGDQMQASIFKQPDGSWTIELVNNTTGWTFSKDKVTYNGPQSSVEWIEEAPAVNGSIAPLANYGEVQFEACTVNGQNPHLTASDSEMMVQNGQIVSTPSLPGSNGNSFNVQYGPTAPNPPSS